MSETPGTSKTLIIAEAGVNHNGDLNTAFQLIEAAAHAGADFVKFQTFTAKEIASTIAEKAAYQKEATEETESQFKMLQRLELSFDDHKKLIDHCAAKRIRFLSSPFDLKSIDLLEELNIEFYKIPSGEITNLPYLKKIGGMKKKVILSSGMAELNEIEEALNVLESSGTKKEDITVLHCNTQYPTPMRDVNLLAMNTIANEFNVKVGYSDHTTGIEVPIAAVALGASVIEKHFTLDHHMEGPDHKASLMPIELKQMVMAIRNIEIAIGNGNKTISDSEAANKEIVRKSIHLNQSLPAGHKLSEEDLSMKRPGSGISPMSLYSVVGKTLNKNLPEDHMLTLDDIS